METNRLIGRKEECERLTRCLNEIDAQLVILYGRRRVGKTFLINRFFEGKFDFRFTGIFEEVKAVQLKNFTNELSRQTGIQYDVPKNWTDAFELLRTYLENLPKENKKIVFFDEMPWMDTKNSGFLSAFEWFWNDWGSTCDNLVFIVCGSATSWMSEKIANNKGGLFNRQTCSIYLKPFNLSEVEKYLESRQIYWSRYDIAQCYMIMGGIPFYLRLLDPKYDFNVNIDRLFFKLKGELWNEFNHLYQTLFSNSEKYIQIVETIEKKKSGLTRTEISDKTGIATNGKLTKMLNDLVDSGFLRKYPFYDKKKKETIYQVSDYYTLFYLRFIKDNYGKDEHAWSNMNDNPKRRAWAGLTFEQLCKDHINEIKQKLGISGVLSETSTWYIKGSQSDMEDSKGAQIDIVIDRRDHVVNLCEIKFSVNEFEIDKNYDMAIRNKIEAFNHNTNCRKTIQVTMITTYGIKNNKYRSIVGKEVVLDDLFHSI